MKTNRYLAIAFCLAALVASARAGEAGQEEDLDAVILNNPNSPTVPPTKVTSDDYIAVVGKYKNSTVKKESHLVKDVVYADKDQNYSLAIDKRDEGRWTLAALYFSKALDNLKDAKWANEYCNYGIGNAFYSAGIFSGYKGRTLTYTPASDYLKKALDANPKSRFMLDIIVKLPVCYAENEKLKDNLALADAAVVDAAKRIADYKKETGSLGAGYSEAADRAVVLLGVAKARIAEKKVAAGVAGITAQSSRDMWREARVKAAKYPDVIGECVEGEFRAMIQMKQYTQAVTEANAIIEKFNQQSDYTLVPQLPAAYMSLGQANLAQGLDFEGKGNKPLAENAYAEARWAFLNIIAQFFDNDDYVAQAHYLSGLCYEKLITVEPSDAQTKAIREWQSVVNNFPKSAYKADAVKKLAAYGVKIEEAPKAAPAAPATPAAPETPKKPEPKKPEPKKPEPKKK
ncbi:MAG: hypothetical protein WCT04_07525 [Planctomycetota bacterium]